MTHTTKAPLTPVTATISIIVPSSGGGNIDVSPVLVVSVSVVVVVVVVVVEVAVVVVVVVPLSSIYTVKFTDNSLSNSS